MLLAYAETDRTAPFRGTDDPMTTKSVIRTEAKRAALIYPLAWVAGVVGTAIVGLTFAPSPMPAAPLRILMPAPPSFMLGPKELPPEARPSQSQSSFIQGG